MVKIAPKVLVGNANVINLAALTDSHAVLMAAVNVDEPAMAFTEVLAPCKIFKIKMNLSIVNTESSAAGYSEPVVAFVYKKEYSMTDVEPPLGWLTTQQLRRNTLWFTRGLFGAVSSMTMRNKFTIKIPKRMQSFNLGDKIIFGINGTGGVISYCLTSVTNAYK